MVSTQPARYGIGGLAACLASGRGSRIFLRRSNAAMLDFRADPGACVSAGRTSKPIVPREKWRPLILMTKFSSAGLMVGVAIVWPLAASAIDFTPDTTRYLSDPSFLPLQGQLDSITTYSHATRNLDWQPVRGIVNEHYSADTNNYVQGISYGITDRLSVSGSGSYSAETAHTTFPFFPAQYTIVAKQFDNPAFALTYRAIQQTESSVSVDLQASFAPPIVANAPGSGSVAMFVSRELRSLTIQGEIGGSYTGSYETGYTVSGLPTSITGQAGYFLAARSQLRLTPQWAINGGVVYSKYLHDTVSSVAFGSYVDTPGSNVTPYFAVVYQIVPNKVDVSVEYDHDFIGDDNHRGSSNGNWINQSRNLYAAHLRLLF